MTHRRRLALAVAAGLALTGLTAPAMANDAAPTVELTNDEDRPWACAAVRQLDQGICISDPLPERLPLPPRPPTH